MPVFIELPFLLCVLCLYWMCRDRRRYLRNRVGEEAFRNVYRVARNVFYMLRRNDLELTGNAGALRRGCVLYSFHFGVWELMPYALRNRGFKIGVVVNKYQRDDKSNLARMIDSTLKKWRAVNGVRVFYSENVMGIVRFIKSGGIFGMLVDGNTFYQKYAKAKKLARVCGVPLVPFAAYRTGNRGVLNIGCDLPGLVQDMPLEYMWFYRSR
jgi:lauroyl/myristoyl acyltransferase